MINVTKTFFPPIKEFNAQVSRIWENQWLTNRGELVLELEDKLKNYLSVSNMFLTNNGTIPLQIALKILGEEGEVITTPFSYVATTSAIVWENCTPVFVDIHHDYLTIDETKIEAAITEKTTCILATHVFGNPCNIKEIEKIAKRYNLKVIYDAAHCFGVKYEGKSIFEYGDISICSFHATKLFHTGEGGALFAKDPDLFFQCFYSHNFGHDGPLSFHGLGINAKMPELNAAMGLAVLPYIDEIIESRKSIVEYYNNNLDFSIVKSIKLINNVNWNYSYYPVIFDSEPLLLQAQAKLNEFQIYPRRYFYPSLNTLPYVDNSKMEVSDNIAKRIFCLPLYHDLTIEEVDLICRLLLRTQNN